MTESKIPGLLAKLEKLDWETYRKYRASMNIGGVILEGEVTLYLLQGVIQDTISEINENGEGREWEFAIAVNQMSFGPIYSAGVWSNCGGELWEGEGRTPAEALLAAYVAALEAEATR